MTDTISLFDDNNNIYWDYLKNFNNNNNYEVDECLDTIKNKKNFEDYNKTNNNRDLDILCNKLKHNDVSSVCISCNKSDFINDNGLIICEDCNTVQGVPIENFAEWRYYGHDDSKSMDPNRVGLPTNHLLPVSSLGSVIGIQGKENYEMRKMRKYDGWNKMPYRERSLYTTFDSFNIKAANVGINSAIVDEAKSMYKEISENKISRGKNKKGLEASCFLMACKKLDVARSAKEIADKFDLNIKTMTKGCKIFQNITNYNVSPTKPEDFIKRFCCKLKYNDDLIELCKKIAEKAVDIVSENTPQSVAAGCIYLVSHICRLKISKREVHLACNVSEVTISKCFKNLLPYIDYIVSTEYKSKFNIN